MGTWGTGLYSDDIAADLKDDWNTRIRWGAKAEELTDDLAREYGTEQAGIDDTAFWLALADVQWNRGQLIPRVRERALEIISTGTDLVRWKDASEADRRARGAVLKKLQAKLQSDPPPTKTYKRPRGADTPMKIGELYAWRLIEGKNAFFQVSGIATNVGAGRAPTVRVLDRVSSDIPPLDELARLPSRRVIRRFERIERAEPTFLEHPQVGFAIYGPAQYPRERLTRLGKKAVPAAIADNNRKVLGGSWLAADEILATVFGIGWWVGDLVAWKRDGASPIVLSIAGIVPIRDGQVTLPRISLEVMDWFRPDLPAAADLPALKPFACPAATIKIPDIDRVFSFPAGRAMEISVVGLPPPDRLQYLGRVAREPSKPRGVDHWDDFDRVLARELAFNGVNT